MASQLRVDEIIASTGSSVAIGTAGGSVTLAGNFTVDTSKGLNVGTGATIFSPSSNVLTLGTNNAERVRIDSSGSVGIGTDNPSTKIHIKADSDTTESVIRVNNNSNNNHFLIGQEGTSGYVIKSTLDLRFDADYDNNTGDAGSNILFRTDGSEKVRITSSGRVGINTSTPAAKLNVVTTSTDDAIIMLEADMGTNNNRVLQFKSPATDSGADPFLIQTGNSIQFRIDSTDALKINDNGNVGIQTNNPYGKLHIGSAAVEDAVNDVDTTNTSLVIKQSTNTRDDGIYIERGGERKGYYMWINPGGGAGDGLTFTRNNNGTKTNALILDREANAHFGGNAVFASGNGIDFSATSNATGQTSELFDDYEEGTWTPDLRFAGSNTGVSYAWRNGHYTKIGRQVTVRGAFGLSSRGTFNATDDAFIYGLPFDVAPYNITGGFHYMFGAAYNGYQGLFQLELQHSASFNDHVPISRQTAWNSAVSPMEYQDIGGGQRMAFTFSYFTAS